MFEADYNTPHAKRLEPPVFLQVWATFNRQPCLIEFCPAAILAPELFVARALLRFMNNLATIYKHQLHVLAELMHHPAVSAKKITKSK